MRWAVAVVLATVVVAGAARAAEPVVLENVKTEWQNLYGAIVYAASANVHNTGAAPVQAVRVRLSLFDKDGKLVIQREAYNLSAEQLTEHPDQLAAVKPIPAGGSDPVRLSIDKADIGKPFRTATLTVAEVK